MTRILRAVLGAALIALGLPGAAGASSRIKDMANVEGIRQNQLIGYGLVVGLNGTGDTLNNIPFDVRLTSLSVGSDGLVITLVGKNLVYTK